MDEALAEEGDIEDDAVTENVERCPKVLMFLEESLFNIEEFQEEIERRKDTEVLKEQQGAAMNVVSDTGDQEQRGVALVERVNVSEENFISYRLGGTERAFTDDSVDAAVAEGQSGGRRIVFSVDEEQRDRSLGLESDEGKDVMASVLAQFDSLGSSANTFQGLHSQPSGLEQQI